MSELDDVIAGLLAERYRKSVWWTTPDKKPVVDDEVTVRRRRREAVDEASRASA